MTARPSHYDQQRVIEEAMASLPSKKWQWLFTPDPRWLASINTTTLREVNAVRMFVGVEVLFAVTYLGVIGFALLRCGVLLQVFGMRLLQVLPPSGKLSFDQWRACEESNATQTLLNFADGLFNGNAILLGVMASVAVGGNILKRVTDTEHQERVQAAKKAPIILPSPPEQPQNQINLNVNEPGAAQSPPGEGVPADPGDGGIVAPGAAQGPGRAVKRALTGVDDARRDDERGEG